ncbi:hypothetical protein K466DRAFT_666346 [Polyporus arcularius HHB13444]|uniref:G-patch domain-containing protein n=1 Tax=Polyporus arcularius HHB13444 TaxID=1314778 RepID=A0A5C3P2Z0_9APHY|nr:hypothetical protein K466DRAFT_666346 [Polyporus arcularius HHB13444]
MATVTHYIYSHYDPPERKDTEDGQLVAENAEEDSRDPWLTESTFGVNRRLKNAPRFVPAIVSYDEVNNMIGGASSAILREEAPPPSAQLSSWYRSLTRGSSAPVAGTQASSPPGVSSTPPPDASNSAAPPKLEVDTPVAGPPHLPRPISPKPSLNPSQAGPSTHRPIAPIPRDKNNWFITNAIRSEPSSSRSTPTPTLADIFTREPPPEPKDQPFVPPVFLHIGPSNKGFAMLQQSGWSEGEALGASAPRRTLTQKALEKRPARTILDDPELSVKMEEREVLLGDDDDETAPDTALERPAIVPSHNPTALLTPIATVLKSDRLGIGLKAKTVGPFKESKKRVTHNQAALAAHVRTTEEMRMRKSLIGRGTKSFARLAKAEAESRKRLLANLNAD